MSILSIQSHVAFGYVGNRSAVLPLELLGFEVWPVNTVQFSNHTGYGAWKGQVFAAAHIDEVIQGMAERGAFGGCEALLSGYLGDMSLGESVLGAYGALKAASPGALYCCDPVMGDYGRGVFVREGIVDFMRRRAVPSATILTPNQFEAELLTGTTITTLDDARKALAQLHEMGPRLVLLTSFCPASAPATEIAMLLSDGDRLYRVTTPQLPMDPLPNGAGDLTAALFLGHYLKEGEGKAALELMADSVFGVFEATAALGRRELALVAARELFPSGQRRFLAEDLGRL